MLPPAIRDAASTGVLTGLGNLLWQRYRHNRKFRPDRRHGEMPLDYNQLALASGAGAGAGGLLSALTGDQPAITAHDPSLRKVAAWTAGGKVIKPIAGAMPQQQPQPKPAMPAIQAMGPAARPAIAKIAAILWKAPAVPQLPKPPDYTMKSMHASPTASGQDATFAPQQPKAVAAGAASATVQNASPVVPPTQAGVEKPPKPVTPGASQGKL